LEAFCHQGKLGLLKSAENSRFLDSQYGISRNKFSPLRGAFFQIFGHKSSIKEETAENIEKYLS
jgi:hypothetical protein